ncbi:MAG: hypothetical protein FWJ93_04230 [Micromonosporaceae bacterium]
MARTPLPRFVGWILIAPAAVLFLLTYVWPTLSLLGESLFGSGGGQAWADPGRAWQHVFSLRYFGRLGYALSYALLPILVIATVAPALAWAASRAGLVWRRAVRVLLAVPLAAFAPAGLALLWTERHRPAGGSLASLAEASINWDGRLVLMATMGAFVLAVAVVCYLAAFRDGTGRGTGSTVVVVGVLLSIVALGFAVQQYTFPDLVDGAPGNRASGVRGTPMLRLGMGDFNAQVAAEAVPVVAVLAVLGLAAAFVVLRTGLRLEFDPTDGADDRPAPAGPPKAAVIGSAAGVAGLLLLIVFQLGPWLVEVATGVQWPQTNFPGLAVLLSTWLIPLGAALVQVVVAAAAAFGIAVVRPLGRRSEWLLLVVAPWLLVGNGLLQLPRVSPGGEPTLLTILAAAVPASWISIPALFLFTMLFRAQADRWMRSRSARQPNAFLRAMWPALPMAVSAVGVTWLMQAQDLLVSTMADAGNGVVAHAQLLMARKAAHGLSTVEPALGYPLVMLVLFTVGALVLQLTYLDRIAVRIGGGENPPSREQLPR